MDTLLNFISNFKPSIIVFTFLISCNYTNHFTTYKEPILRDESRFINKLNGIYLGVNNSNAFYLYENGMVRYITDATMNDSFWLNPEIESKNLYSSFVKYPAWESEFWGNYSIKNDSIYIVVFNRNFQSEIKRYSIYYVGRINNDSIIQINYSLINWPYKYQKEYNSKIVYNPIEIFRFYPTSLKPDSTTAWFIDRKWYNDGLHPSRKCK